MLTEILTLDGSRYSTVLQYSHHVADSQITLSRQAHCILVLYYVARAIKISSERHIVGGRIGREPSYYCRGLLVA
jgi:hypothetical protein